MISTIKLKFGRVPDASPEVINATPITVFVGPNNSGKSKVLTEIQHYCSSGEKISTFVILDDLAFVGFGSDLASSILDKAKLSPNANEAVPADHIIVGGLRQRRHVPLSRFKNVLENPVEDISAFCHWFLRDNTLMLDGSSRIDLVKPSAGGDLQSSQKSSLQELFTNDGKRHEVRRIVHEAFGSYFVIDPTNLGQLRIRLSETPPQSDLEERGIHKEALQFHRRAQLIDSASDGVKAFTGILMELLAGDPRVVLIDEPEAFLHPALASKLGLEISRAALGSNKRVSPPLTARPSLWVAFSLAHP